MSAKHLNLTSQKVEWAREKQITAQFGLSHTILYNLRREGKIRTVSLRGEGKQYGARLFNVASVREYLAKQEAMTSDSSNSCEATVTETLNP